MNFPQTLVGNVSVNLGGGNGGMAEQGLDTADIRAVLQKIRGKAVAQGMGRNFFYNSRQPAIFFYNPFNFYTN